LSIIKRKKKRIPAGQVAPLVAASKTYAESLSFAYKVKVPNLFSSE